MVWIRFAQSRHHDIDCLHPNRHIKPHVRIEVILILIRIEQRLGIQALGHRIHRLAVVPQLAEHFLHFTFEQQTDVKNDFSVLQFGHIIGARPIQVRIHPEPHDLSHLNMLATHLAHEIANHVDRSSHLQFTTPTGGIPRIPFARFFGRLTATRQERCHARRKNHEACPPFCKKLKHSQNLPKAEHCFKKKSSPKQTFYSESNFRYKTVCVWWIYSLLELN